MRAGGAPVPAVARSALAIAGIAALVTGVATAPDPADARADDPAAVVKMVGIEFQPDTVTITTGETVEWVNESKLTHTVTADPTKAAKAANVTLPDGAEPFDSGDVAPGETYRRTFTVPGTYGYFCVPHEAAGMTGTVVVKPPK